jgi:hypothetical protein
MAKRKKPSKGQPTTTTSSTGASGKKGTKNRKKKKKQKKTPPTIDNKYGSPPVAMLGLGAGPPLVLKPYSIGFKGTSKTTTVAKWMMRGFGGGVFKQSVKEHASEAAAVKHINATVRKKLNGVPNKEVDGGPRLNTFLIVAKGSECEDRSHHIHHALADIYTQCGIPACCADLTCDECFFCGQ